MISRVFIFFFIVVLPYSLLAMECSKSSINIGPFSSLKFNEVNPTYLNYLEQVYVKIKARDLIGNPNRLVIGERQKDQIGKSLHALFPPDNLLKVKSLFSTRRLVEIVPPKSIQQVIYILEYVSRRDTILDVEYGLVAYADSSGKARFFIQLANGRFTGTVGLGNVGVDPALKLKDQDGKILYFMGLLGHTHSNGYVEPSESDFAAQGWAKILKFKYSILVLANTGGANTMFDSKRTYSLSPKQFNSPIGMMWDRKLR
ncbi:MAG: hypothetical protein VX642_16380 [Bdellovibrionota bacterium]|nr:hypothetical protein [Bdellovibrionota bacterium]